MWNGTILSPSCWSRCHRGTDSRDASACHKKEVPKSQVVWGEVIGLL